MNLELAIVVGGIVGMIVIMIWVSAPIASKSGKSSRSSFRNMDWDSFDGGGGGDSGSSSD